MSDKARSSWDLPHIHSAAPIIFGISLIGFWFALVYIFSIPGYLVPSPASVLNEFIARGRLLALDTLITAQEAGMGFLIGTTFGFLCGVVFAHSRLLEKTFQPYLVGLQAIPVVAIAPLLVIWFGSGIAGKVALSAFISYFPVVISTSYGLRRIQNEMIELFSVLRATKMQTLTKLRIPHALPYIFSSLRVSATLSVIGAIVGEMAGANQGLGHRILVASYRTETALMFAGIACASALGLLFFAFVHLSGTLMLKNHNHDYTNE
jgi:NitT/TauT family transport system permease protein